jgi:CubicO group peptidase (beta-lactamase class C family)
MTRARLLLLPLALLLGSARAPEAAGWARITGDGEVSAAALTSAIDPLFDPANEDAIGRSNALLVMRGGRIIAERYAPGIGPDTRLRSWSIGKTVTALLVGIMVADGRLVLDAPAPVRAWQQPGDPRAAITLRQLLTMSSGLRHNEYDEPVTQSVTLRMLFGDEVADSARFAADKPLAHPPGTTFQYSTATTQILCGMLADLLTDSTDPRARRDAMTQFVRTRLIEPVGLASLVPEFDASGTMMGGAFLHMTARDYARLGEFLRRRGRVEGRQVLPARWFDVMTSPSAANPGYGGQIWLNRPGAERALFVGRLSPRVYGATGLRGQMVVVVPDRRLVVVRLGVTPTALEPAMRARIADLIEAVPAG